MSDIPDEQGDAERAVYREAKQTILDLVLERGPRLLDRGEVIVGDRGYTYTMDSGGYRMAIRSIASHSSMDIFIESAEQNFVKITIDGREFTLADVQELGVDALRNLQRKIVMLMAPLLDVMSAPEIRRDEARDDFEGLLGKL